MRNGINVKQALLGWTYSYYSDIFEPGSKRIRNVFDFRHQLEGQDFQRNERIMTRNVGKEK